MVDYFFRRFKKSPSVIYRDKIPNKFDFPDLDASWLANPIDVKNLLLGGGFKIVKYQKTESLEKPSFKKRIASVLVPEQMGIIRIVAQKQ